jgi:hypothetical protein
VILHYGNYLEDVGAVIIFISYPDPMPKQPRVDDEDYSTSDDIEIFFD